MRHIRLCLRVQDSPHLCSALVAALLLGCGAKAEDTGSGSDAPPSFAKVRDEVLVPSCGFGSCHGAGEAGLQIDGDMTADALVDAPSTVVSGEILVIAGETDSSYLIAKMEEEAGIDGEVMPPSGALSADRIAIVRDWIEAGASH